ncbi:hypothetical protein Tco_1059857, partial [Tanacetum coccineum]
MEDPESDEWEIQEYASFKECDEPSTVKWILNKGCWIGKKMVITGIAITSAPIVLPPLVVFSAMGVAFSVPFGLVFASYACTNKLMSMLLPIPPSPLMLEYYGDDYDQEKEDGVACRFELDDGAGDYVNEKGYFSNEYEDYEIVRENVIPEEEQEQIGDGYVQQEVEALVANVDEKGYYTDEEENVVDNERTEDLNQGVDMVFELDDNMRQGEALVVDEDEKGYNSSEYEGNELGKENVMREDEEERISDVYGNEVEALLSHVEEDVKEKGYYTDEEEIEEIEGTDDKLRLETVDNELMEDINHGVDIVLDLYDGGNDTSPLREAVVVNVVENFDGRSYYINENDNEREMEDHVHLMENAVKEEESEQMEDIKQGVEFRLGLNVAAEECKQMEDGTITYIGGTDDDKGYEEESEQMEDIKQVVEMRHGLDVAADECKQTEEETITNIGVSVDDKRYEEESEQMEDIRQGVEMRVGLDVAPDECKQTEEGTITSIDGSVDDKGYEEDVGESLEGDVDHSLEEEQKGNELLIESHLDENRCDAPVVTLYDKEKEGRGVVKVDYSIDETASNVILEEVTDDKTADPVTVREIDSQKLFEDESKNEEPVGEM